MKLALALLCLAAMLEAVAYGQAPAPLLDREDAWLLIMNIPDVIELEARRGCPHLEFSPTGKDRMWVHVRNGCPKSGAE